MLKESLDKRYSEINQIETISLDNKVFIGETNLTKAKVFINPNGNAGKFLCSHVMRIITDFKQDNLGLISGFIHIPEFPNFSQLSEVLSIAIKNYCDNYKSNDINILFSGFTRFGKVINNSSSNFLFNDGISDNIDSFGLKEPFKDNILSILSFLDKTNDDLDICIKDQFLNFKIKEKNINLFFLRLPVKDSFTKDKNEKDITGDILKSIFYEINPDLIISLGVGIYDKTDEYNIEINAEGMSGANYKTNEFIPNYDLSLIYNNYFNKENICQQ
jgi:hypothetical protein